MVKMDQFQIIWTITGPSKSFIDVTITRFLSHNQLCGEAQVVVLDNMLDIPRVRIMKDQF